MSDCIFCKIVNGEIPSTPIYENDDMIAITDVGHVNRGHTLVIAKRHAETMMDLDENTAASAFKAANRVAKAIEKAYQPDGMTILQANRPAGMQTIPHFHLHVLPRHQDDGVAITWPAKNPAPEELAEIASEIREAIAL
jgi:histidine triad (HIT) family protein